MPRVNFHGRFRPAVNSLVDHLKGQSEKHLQNISLWPLPPIVGVTASLLLLMVGLTMFLADWGEITSGAAVGRPLTIFELAILFGAVGLFIWHTSIAYLRRRMGMTRLAVILGYFVFAYGYPVLQHFKAPDVPAIFPDCDDAGHGNGLAHCDSLQPNVSPMALRSDIFSAGGFASLVANGESLEYLSDKAPRHLRT